MKNREESDCTELEHIYERMLGLDMHSDLSFLGENTLIETEKERGFQVLVFNQVFLFK